MQSLHLDAGVVRFVPVKAQLCPSHLAHVAVKVSSRRVHRAAVHLAHSGLSSRGAALSTQPTGTAYTAISSRSVLCRAGGEGAKGDPPIIIVTDQDAKPHISAPKQPSFFSSLFRSLQDYGVGRRALVEGSTGLFVAVGGGFCVALVMWARGQALKTGTPYQAVIELPLACGVTVGTPLRIRGVQVGTVLNVASSLAKVDVLVEVNDVTTVIPRNSKIEANQSGLIAEPLLDVTPQLPLPDIRYSPRDAGCAEEGSILCHNGRMKGEQGVSLDDLVLIMTRMARTAEAGGVDKIFAAAEAATAAIKEAEPLLHEAAKLTEQITPLLRELRDGGLVGNLDQMTSAAAAAAADIQKLQTAIMTEENVKALRQTVLTLCKTLEHVESISGDVSVFSRDSGTQRNLKTLVQALSRLVDE